MILFDFSKAFDRVFTSFPLRSEITGIKGPFLSWLCIFSSNCFRRVSDGDHPSSTTSILNGVMQGCVLGPALYSTYSSCISNL